MNLSCQIIVDSSSKIECKLCKKCIETELIILTIKDEKHDLEKRLIEMKDDLKRMTGKLIKYQQQRDGAQLALKKVATDLIKAKSQCSDAEKAKAKVEHVLKNEISQLLHNNNQRDSTKIKLNFEDNLIFETESSSQKHRDYSSKPYKNEKTLLNKGNSQTKSCIKVKKELKSRNPAQSPSIIPRSVNYSTNKTPIRSQKNDIQINQKKTNCTQFPTASNIYPETESNLNSNSEDEELTNYEFNDDIGTFPRIDQSMTLSPAEGTIPVPRTTIKHSLGFSKLSEGI